MLNTWRSLVTLTRGAAGILLVLAGLLRVSQPTSAADGKFVNLSTRALVETGEEVMIGGFIIREGAKEVLIQALGPELANAGIANALADPVLTVTNTTDSENPIEIRVNDNWEDSQGQLISDLWGGYPNLAEGSLSAAVFLTLEPGNYTAKVEGKDGTAGVAIVEVYGIDSPGAGSGVTQLRNEGSPSDPAWSPDGTRIAFSGLAPLANYSDIFVMNVDGSGVTNLTNNSDRLQKNPIWSPDGTRIAFSFRTGQRIGPDPYEISVMNADGSDLTWLTNQSVWEDAPAWSPDGTRIAFSGQSPIGGNSDIYVVNVDGSGVTNLTNNSDLQERDPAWSPDGTKIAFSSYSDIYVMNADGSGVTQFSNPGSDDKDPVWSPDGTRIAFSGHSPVGNFSDIYVMNLDGSGLTNLTNHPSVDMDPAWSPDGTRIAFSSLRDNPLSFSLYVLGVSQLTLGAAGEFVNLSTRALVETGEEVMIGGFIIREGAKQVLIQAVGPELANAGIVSALVDPVLTVTNTTDPGNPIKVLVNDNWEDSQGQLVTDLLEGSSPLTAGSLSAAGVLTLDPGNYTAKVEGNNGATGVAIVEVYGFDSPEIRSPDRVALTVLYNAMDGAHWRRNTNWLSGAPLDQWEGVNSDDLDRVTRLDLSVNRLSGPIPSELGDLVNLQYLDLSSNKLSGLIPPELGNLTSLILLRLDDNQFTGNIPLELVQLSNLQELSLSVNRLNGPIPSELGDLVNLQYLNLYRNKLSGLIPPELAQLSDLLYLDLSGNELTGTIPPELAQLFKLQELRLSGNKLSGLIPPELAGLVNLQYLNLAANQLSGTIPSELGNLANLLTLALSDTQLRGPIPAELGRLANLERLFLYRNHLSGAIPPELAGLGNLKQLSLTGNQLGGPIPAELGQLTNLTELRLTTNQLRGPIPIELTKLSNLQRFFFDNNDGLCAPNTAAFTDWLQKVGAWNGPRCD